MRYQFEHDKITCCEDCPLLYDYLCCVFAENGEIGHGGMTFEEDGHRPEWCPLRELRE